jgi:hypothetical protein
MKKILLLSVMVSMALVGFSQSNKEDIDLVQAMFGKEKKAMLMEFVQLETLRKMLFGLPTMSMKPSARNSARNALTFCHDMLTVT